MRARSLADRFFEKYERGDGCWEWLGSRNSSGYGLVSDGRKHRRASRVSWELHVGPIPVGLFILHACDNPPCVRPGHLRPGTQVENVREMVKKGRWRDKGTASRVARYRSIRQPRGRRVTKPCEYCRVQFKAKQSNIKVGRARFCSRGCWGAARRAAPRVERLNVELFWSKVDKSDGPNGCWLWRGNIHGTGYGRFYDNAKKKVERASRVAWEIANGRSADDLCVCHSCDNPPCVNPAHLWLGTDKDNAVDKVAKGRARCRFSTPIEIARKVRAAALTGEPQHDVARRFGLHQSTVSRIKTGARWWSVLECEPKGGST